MIHKLLKLLPLLIAVALVVGVFVDMYLHLGKAYGDPTRIVTWSSVIGVPLSFISLMIIGVLAYKSLEDE